MEEKVTAMLQKKMYDAYNDLVLTKRIDASHFVETKTDEELKTYLAENNVSYSWLISNHEELVISAINIYSENLANEEIYNSI